MKILRTLALASTLLLPAIGTGCTPDENVGKSDVQKSDTKESWQWGIAPLVRPLPSYPTGRRHHISNP